MEDTLSVKLNGEVLSIKMSYGLLNVLTRRIGDLEAVTDIFSDGHLQSDLLVEVFSKRGPRGEIVEEFNLFGSDLDSETVLSILEWIAEHVTDFFLKGLSKTKDLITEERREMLRSLMPS